MAKGVPVAVLIRTAYISFATCRVRQRAVSRSGEPFSVTAGDVDHGAGLVVALS